MKVKELCDNIKMHWKRLDQIYKQAKNKIRRKWKSNWNKILKVEMKNWIKKVQNHWVQLKSRVKKRFNWKNKKVL
jgi:hypothetical protein